MRTALVAKLARSEQAYAATSLFDPIPFAIFEFCLVGDAVPSSSAFVCAVGSASDEFGTPLSVQCSVSSIGIGG